MTQLSSALACGFRNTCEGRQRPASRIMKLWVDCGMQFVPCAVRRVSGHHRLGPGIAGLADQFPEAFPKIERKIEHALGGDHRKDVDPLSLGPTELELDIFRKILARALDTKDILPSRSSLAQLRYAGGSCLRGRVEPTTRASRSQSGAGTEPRLAPWRIRSLMVCSLRILVELSMKVT